MWLPPTQGTRALLLRCLSAASCSPVMPPAPPEGFRAAAAAAAASAADSSGAPGLLGLQCGRERWSQSAIRDAAPPFPYHPPSSPPTAHLLKAEDGRPDMSSDSDARAPPAPGYGATPPFASRMLRCCLRDVAAELTMSMVACKAAARQRQLAPGVLWGSSGGSSQSPTPLAPPLLACSSSSKSSVSCASVACSAAMSRCALSRADVVAWR